MKADDLFYCDELETWISAGNKRLRIKFVKDLMKFFDLASIVLVVRILAKSGLLR